MQELLNSLGVLGSRKDKEEAVLSVFRSTHRTLQQQFVRTVILPILRYLAKAHQEGNVDLRNEASAALAYKMLSAVSEDEQYLPFV